MAHDVQIAVDCARPHELADWWAEALGWQVEAQDEAFIRRMVDTGAAAESDALRAALLKLGAFGFQASTPVVAVGDDTVSRAALNTQGIALLKEGKARIAEADALIVAPAVAERRGRRDQLLERMRTVFGSGTEECSGRERVGARWRRAKRLHMVHARGACSRPARALERAAQWSRSARNRREPAASGRAITVQCRRPVGRVAAD